MTTSQTTSHVLEHARTQLRASEAARYEALAITKADSSPAEAAIAAHLATQLRAAPSMHSSLPDHVHDRLEQQLEEQLQATARSGEDPDVRTSAYQALQLLREQRRGR